MDIVILKEDSAASITTQCCAQIKPDGVGRGLVGECPDVGVGVTMQSLWLNCYLPQTMLGVNMGRGPNMKS